jgi:ferritin-like metal-binding protein YciE
MNSHDKPTYSPNSIDPANNGVMVRKQAQVQDRPSPTQLMQLFSNELKSLFWIENALLESIPKLIKYTTSTTLKAALSLHVQETMIHVTRLEHAFALLGEKPESAKNLAVDGLIKEAFEVVEKCDKGPMCDAGIISSVQKIEHYEIAAYGTLRQFAKTMRLHKVYDLLDSTLIEEKEADLELTEIAIGQINKDAADETKND